MVECYRVPADECLFQMGGYSRPVWYRSFFTEVIYVFGEREK